MKKLKGFVILLLIGFTLLFPNKTILACMGTPCPDCCRTAWLAKFTSSTVLFPSIGTPIAVPINMLPFVSWITSATPACPPPRSASLSVTLTCTPAGGGPAITIGPTPFAAPVPGAPGVQPLIPITFTIPANTFATLTPQICTIVGVYTVTFADGTSISGTGDTKVCLVPPSVTDPSIPELNVEHVEINGEKFHTCLKGDQVTLFYLIENNDPDRSVTLKCSSTTTQVAKMPSSDPPNDPSLFAIADPSEGTDAFFQKFSDSGDLGALADPPDPMENSNREITRDITIPAKGITIVSIDMRSWGMCANGSCSDNLVVYEGEWSDGKPALGCAGTALVVGDATPKSALCDVEDAVKSSQNANVDWSLAEFGNSDGPFVAAITFPHGQHTSQNMENMPEQATDAIRTDLLPTESSWGANGSANFPEAGINGQNVFMAVNVTGLNPELPAAVPLIGFGETADSNIKLDINMQSEQITVLDMRDANSVILDQEIFVDDSPSDISFQAGEEIDVRDIQDSEFGQSLFIIPPEDGCDCTHLHGTIFIEGIGPFSDPAPDGCGFGCVGPSSTIPGTLVFDGSLPDFLVDPPTGINIDHDTCRTITIACPPDPTTQPIIALDPAAYAESVDTSTIVTPNFKVINARNQQTIPWSVAGSVPGIAPEAVSGGSVTDLEVMVDPSQIDLFPGTTRAFFEIDSPNALGLYILPVFARAVIGVPVEICDNDIDDDGDGLVDSADPDCKRFRFSCERTFSRGNAFNLERLVMEAGENQGCILTITNLEPGTEVEIATKQRPAFNSSIEVVPAKGVTDENGKIAFTIIAVEEGTSWVAWAAKNKEGRFRFNKEAYDNGDAWGMFVHVK